MSWAKKKSGIELLSHTLMCSTIVAWPLNDRVRDGNVCCKPAIDTGKNMYKEEDDKGSKRLCSKSVEIPREKTFLMLAILSILITGIMEIEKKVVKPHGRLVMVSWKHYCSYTSILSRLWSTTGLQGTCVPGHRIIEGAWRLDAFSAYPFPT